MLTQNQNPRAGQDPPRAQAQQAGEDQQSGETQPSVPNVWRGYSDEEWPLAQYAGLIGLFTAAFAGLAATGDDFDERNPGRLPGADLLLLGVATHKLARIITRDWVTAPLRAPFTHYEGPVGSGEQAEKSRGHGWQQAVGSLLTCPWCIGPWVATGLLYAYAADRRSARLAGTVLAMTAMSDFLHHAYDRTKAKG